MFIQSKMHLHMQICIHYENLGLLDLSLLEVLYNKNLLLNNYEVKNIIRYLV